jgi:hypothetical protein
MRSLFPPEHRVDYVRTRHDMTFPDQDPEPRGTPIHPQDTNGERFRSRLTHHRPPYSPDSPPVMIRE